jgi:basic membrane protein A
MASSMNEEFSKRHGAMESVLCEMREYRHVVRYERDGSNLYIRTNNSNPSNDLMHLSRRSTLRGLGIVGTAGVAGCLGSDGDEPDGDSSTQNNGTQGDGSEDSDVRVSAAFVYHDAVGDFGWQMAHDRARRTVERKFDWVDTEIFADLAPEGSVPRFRQIAERDFDIIFGTSFGYMDAMYEVAPDYPEVAFENCSGYKDRANLGRYFGRMYQPRFLSGVAAGMLTEEHELGFVAAFPISEVIRGINAFALGAASVNDTVTVRVRYTKTWNNAIAERNAAQQLIDEGVDVMAQHQNFPAAAKRAAEAGIWASGYNSPMGDYVGERYVTSPIWNWEVFYRQALREIDNDSWESDAYWKGLNAGIVDLSPWGPNVPGDVVSAVEQQRSAITDGDRRVWDGTKFEEFDDEELFQDVESYVAPVAGDVPV